MQVMKPSSHIPPGFQAVTPYFLVDEPERLVEFVKSAFSAEELPEQRALGPNGRIMHAAFRIEGSIFEIGRADDRWKPLTLGIHLFVPDVDAIHAPGVGGGRDKPAWSHRHGLW